MSMELRNLSVLNYAGGYTTWSYLLRELPIAVVDSENFFGECASMMAVGDMIIVSSNEGGTHRFVTRAEVNVVRIAPPL